MKTDDWKKLRYFTEAEAWGNPEKMSLPFLLKLDKWRGELNSPFIITAASSASGHLKNSQHYLTPCAAVDGYFEKTAKSTVSPLHCFFAALNCGFKGIGLYPNNGNWFIHVDDRNGPFASWIRDDSGTYHPLNGDTFKKYLGEIQLAYADL